MHWILLLTLAFDLTSVKSEPNLEKRSELALDHANVSLDAARDDYNAGDVGKTQTELEEMCDSVDVAFEALANTGKDPHKDPKFFKRAELRTNELLRRLESLAPGMSGLDRSTLENVRARISMVHDDLLKGIMSKKKK
jgi:hypothetical protein